MGKRSDEADRRAVLNALEANLGVKLAPIGSRRKYFADSDTVRRFCIVVGEEFHGLPFEVVEDAKAGADVSLVVGMKYQDRISVFAGSIAPLLPEVAQLSSSKHEYKFNIRSIGRRVLITQVPTVSLEHVCDIAYGAEEHDRLATIRSVEKLLKGLTPEERVQFLAELETKTKQ